MKLDPKAAAFAISNRRGLKVSAGYVAAVVVGLELLDIVLPTLGAPVSILRVAVVVSLAGYPAALLLAWAFDMDAKGASRSSVTRMASLFLSTLLVGGSGWWYSGSGVSVAAVADVDPVSIAVLPFADLSPRGDQAYLGDGLAEEILNVLTRIEGLQVAARTSSFAFRDGEWDIREVARQLGVANVLEGSVRTAGDQVRITAQLIDANTGFHRWSETYDRQLVDVFEVQDEIAGAIVRALEVTLGTAPEATRPVHPVAPDVYDRYLRGRLLWNRRTPAGLAGAIDLFAKAVDADPEFAQAYTGLADAYALLPIVSPGIEAGWAWGEAMGYAERALAVDPELAEAWASRALVKAFAVDLPGALADLDRAIALNPSFSTARQWRANTLAELGRHGEAVQEARAARNLDPLSVSINTDLGYTLLFAGELRPAAAAFREATELDDRFESAWFGLALAEIMGGALLDASDALGTWADLTGADPAMFARVAETLVAQRQSGRAGEPSAELIRTIRGHGDASAGARAVLLALLGAKDDALEEVAASVTDRSYVDHHLRVHPAFADIRAEPEFQAVFIELGGA